MSGGIVPAGSCNAGGAGSGLGSGGTGSGAGPGGTGSGLGPGGIGIGSGMGGTGEGGSSGGAVALAIQAGYPPAGQVDGLLATARLGEAGFEVLAEQAADAEPRGELVLVQLARLAFVNDPTALQQHGAVRQA